MTRPLTIRLELPDYERLEMEAKGLGMRPGTLAKVLLHGTLIGVGAEAALPVRGRLAALDRLVALSTGTAPADAVALLHESREAVGERPS